MRYLLAGLVLCLAAEVPAASVLPSELVGIWATPGSVFHGNAIWDGQAIAALVG